MLTAAACGTAPIVAPTPLLSAPTAAGIHGDHGGMTALQSYDALFIDSMIVHHEGAITMERQALQSAERPEIRRVAEEIIAAQQAEIERMRAWRAAWYPDLPPTAGMTMDMGPMEVAPSETPFDRRFLEAMIPHHEGAVAMARDALQKAEHCEIGELATATLQHRKPRLPRCDNGSKNGMASNREPLTGLLGQGNGSSICSPTMASNCEPSTGLLV